jgi:hypothetical protein
MKKLVIAAVSVALALVAVEPAHAQDQKVLAIIDTAIDSNEVKSVIYEACFTQNKSCPNNANFMEGSGSANSLGWPSSIQHPVYHGHNMAQAALLSDPTIKIVFVRIANINSRDLASLNAELSLVQAVEWVSKNASKYSIDAVSISQAGSSRESLASCTTNASIINSVSALSVQNIPVFAATGNNSTLTAVQPVSFPACVSGVIGVGAVKSSLSGLANDTNRGVGLDIIAAGTASILRYKMTKVATVSGTSVSTQIAAALYVKNSAPLNANAFISQLPKVLGYPYISS